MFLAIIESLLQIDASKFEFEKQYFSTRDSVFTVFVSYLALIFSLQFLMKNQVAVKLNFLFVLHNTLLSIGSLILLGSLLQLILPVWSQNGLFYVMCSKNFYTNQLQFLYYVNYCFKFYELLGIFS